MFYKVEDGILLFGKQVTSLLIDLTLATKDNYSYPQDGWYYFTTEEEARAFFNIPADVSVN